APVYRVGGVVVAALSVSGPATRLTADRLADVADRCMAEANALSAALGHRPERSALAGRNMTGPSGPSGRNSPGPGARNGPGARGRSGADPSGRNRPRSGTRDGPRPTPLAARHRPGPEGLPRARREGSPQPKKAGAA